MPFNPSTLIFGLAVAGVTAQRGGRGGRAGRSQINDTLEACANTPNVLTCIPTNLADMSWSERREASRLAVECLVDVDVSRIVDADCAEALDELQARADEAAEQQEARAARREAREERRAQREAFEEACSDVAMVTDCTPAEDSGLSRQDWREARKECLLGLDPEQVAALDVECGEMLGELQERIMEAEIN